MPFQHPFKGNPCAYAALVSMTWTPPCRGDAAKLPQQVLDLCEIEPLRQEERGSTRCVWRFGGLATAATTELS